MIVKSIRNTTTEASPVQWEVVVRINTFDYRDAEFASQLVATVTKAIEGIDPQ